MCACKVERPAAERPIQILPDPKNAGSYEPESLPIVAARIADCIAMEDTLQAGKLVGEDREEMIRHTMFSFARIYDEEPFERIKPWVRLTMTIMILVIAGLGVYSMQRSGSMLPMLSAAGAIAMVIFALLYWVTTHSPRKRVRTWLATALLPIDPSGDEIRKARREMQASRIKAGDCIRSEKVLAKMKKLKASTRLI